MTPFLFLKHYGYFRENIASPARNYLFLFDSILIDCPPSLGLLTVNALTLANGILIPVQAAYHALAGLALIRQTVSAVQENLNASLNILGLVLTFYDTRKKLNRNVAACLKAEWGACFLPPSSGIL